LIRFGVFTLTCLSNIWRYYSAWVSGLGILTDHQQRIVGRIIEISESSKNICKMRRDDVELKPAASHL
jgi:hypothetical protein